MSAGADGFDGLIGTRSPASFVAMCTSAGGGALTCEGETASGDDDTRVPPTGAASAGTERETAELVDAGDGRVDAPADRAPIIA